MLVKVQSQLENPPNATEIFLDA